MVLQTDTRRLVAGILLFCVTALIGFVTYPDLPARVTTHWNAAGQPDGTTAKSVFVVSGPAFIVCLLVFFEAIPRIDPLGENIAAFRAAYDAGAVLLMGFVAYMYGFIVVWNLGYQIPIEQALAPAIAVLYVAIGYVLERAKPNWFVGIRTPWTLSSETVWRHTHDHAATLFKLAGVLALGGLIFPAYFVYFIAGPAAAIAVFTTVYSYLDYRRLDEESPGVANRGK